MKSIDVTIDGKNYHVINILSKPENRLIFRAKATSGQSFQVDFHKVHHISYKNGEETVDVNALLKSAWNSEKIIEMVFRLVNE